VLCLCQTASIAVCRLWNGLTTLFFVLTNVVLRSCKPLLVKSLRVARRKDLCKEEGFVQHGQPSGV
jgi:hypothetical protein